MGKGRHHQKINNRLGQNHAPVVPPPPVARAPPAFIQYDPVPGNRGRGCLACHGAVTLYSRPQMTHHAIHAHELTQRMLVERCCRVCGQPFETRRDVVDHQAECDGYRELRH